MIRKNLAILMALGIAAISSVANAEVYRWVDEQGVVHYGDRAPDGVEATLVGVNPNTVQISRPEPPAPEVQNSDAAAADRAPEQLSYAEQRRKERAEQRSQAREKAQELQSDCNIMRKRKDFLEPSPRVLVEDEDGTTRRMDDDERIRLLNEANRFLDRNCRSN